MDAAALFAAVAGTGPFFAVATEPQPGEWVAVGDAGALDRRIAVVRAALGTDARVAASTAFLGLAAQVVAPLFAAVAVAGALPVGVDALRWRAAGPPWLWWTDPAAPVRAADATNLATVLVDLLGPPVAALRPGVSARVLWGNVASAVASAGGLLAVARPAAAARATALAGQLLAAPPWAVTAGVGADGRFRRRSCCLYYRAPGGGLCADCVLHTGGRDRGRLA